MSILSDNLKFLRSRAGRSQQSIASQINLPRSTYAAYEEGKSEPPIAMLRILSSLFEVSIDIMVSVDLRNIDPNRPFEVEGNRIILPMKKERSEGRNSIVIIPHSAKAGQLVGYDDPEYIQELQKMSLPFLGAGNFRAFRIEGNSMPPYDSGTYIVGRHVEQLQQIRKGGTYVFVTLNDGIIYKRVQEIFGTEIVLRSDNPEYSDFALPLSELLEAWAFELSINSSDIGREYFTRDFVQLFRSIKDDLSSIRNGS